MSSYSAARPGQIRRDRLRERASPSQPSLLVASEPEVGADDATTFEEFDVEDQLWSVPGTRSAGFASQAGSFRGRSMKSWMVIIIGAALLSGGFILLATICFSSHRAWLPSDALVETFANESHSSLVPKPLSMVDASMWWLAIVGTVVGNGALLLSHARSPRWAVVFAIVTGTLTLVQVVFVLVLSRGSLHFFSAKDEPGTLLRLRQTWSRVWVALTLHPSGAAALCAIQQRFQCSGLTMCCLTNSSPIEISESGTSQRFCFVTYGNGSIMTLSGVDVGSRVEQECGYLARDVSCAAPSSLDTCLGPMEGALLAPHGLVLAAHCTWAALLFALTHFTAGLARARPRPPYTTHVVLSTDAPTTRSGVMNDQEYDPYAY